MYETDDFSLKCYFIPFTTGKALHFLILIGVVIFFNGLFNGFVQDDHAQIVNKPTIHSLTHIATYFFESRLLIGEQSFIGGMYYKPILDTTFAMIYAFSGTNYFWFHFVQISLYITNACLVFFFLKRFFHKVPAFFLALVFLIHPMNNEAAFYISAMQEVLFLFFGMVALIILQKSSSHKKFLLISFLLLCSLLSKETGVLFVGITILYTYLFQREQVFPLGGYVLGAFGLYTALRIHAVGFFTQTTAVSPIETLGLYERVLHAPSIILFYLKTLVFPLFISSSHQWIYQTVEFQNFYLPLLMVMLYMFILLLSGFFVYMKDQSKDGQWRNRFVFFSVWFLMGIGFHIQILPLDQTVAERWFYFPFIGLLGMIGVVYSLIHTKTFLKRDHLKIVVLSFFALILFLFAFRTFLRSFDFRNDFVLAATDIQVSPESYNLEYILSRQYYDQGNLEEAKKHAQKSIQLFPQITNHTNLGAIYSRMGDYKLAKQEYQNALQYGDDTLPYENIASLALVYGNIQENINFIQQKGLKKYPKNGKLWFTLALLEYKSGNKKNALYAIEQAKRYGNTPFISYIGEVFRKDKTVVVQAENGEVKFTVLDKTK